MNALVRVGLAISLAALLGLLLVPVFVAASKDEVGLFWPTLAHSLLSGAYFLVLLRRNVPSLALTLFGLFEVLRGTIAPLIIIYFGQEKPQWRSLSTVGAAEQVLWLGFAFFAVVALVTMWPRPISRQRTWAPETISISKGMVWGLILAGCLGLVLRFPTVNALAAFLTGTELEADLAGVESGGGLVGLSASLLRPLLPLGIGLLIIRRRQANGRSPWLLWIIWGLVSYVALSSYGLNRATILLPTAAFVYCYMEVFKVRITTRRILLFGAGFAWLFLTIGNIRSSVSSGIGGSSAQEPWWSSGVQSLLVYAQSPLQTGVIFDDGGWSGSTILASLLSPIPAIGKPWREFSGTAEYNEIIYGPIGTVDQILPSWLEFYLGHGIIALVMFGIFIGFTMIFLDRCFMRSANFLQLYSTVLIIAFVSQISITSISANLQSLIYLTLTPAIIAIASNVRWGARRVRPSASLPSIVG